MMLDIDTLPMNQSVNSSGRSVDWRGKSAGQPVAGHRCTTRHGRGRRVVCPRTAQHGGLTMHASDRSAIAVVSR